MPVTKMSHGGGRPLSFCYYHRRYKEEASKCSKGELCEFQNLDNQKQFPDLRNNIPHDLRNSLQTDLRVHLRNQGAIPKAKRPKQDDLRSRQSRPRTAWEEKSRAEIEDNVVEGEATNLFQAVQKQLSTMNTETGNTSFTSRKSRKKTQLNHMISWTNSTKKTELTNLVVPQKAEDTGRERDL
jgi:hypothetical protein